LAKIREDGHRGKEMIKELITQQPYSIVTWCWVSFGIIYYKVAKRDTGEKI